MLRILILVVSLLCMSLPVFAQPHGPGPGRHDPPGYGHRPPQHQQYTLDISSNRGGDVSPRGHMRVSKGETIDISIRPNRGFDVKSVIIDGRNVGPIHRYEFRRIDRSHTVYVEFVPERRPPQRSFWHR